MVDFKMNHPGLDVTAKEKVEFYKNEFLSFISEVDITPASLVWAWRIFVLQQDAKLEVLRMNPAANVHLHVLLDKFENREYFDPTESSLAVFSLTLSTVRRNGEVKENSILLDLPADKFEKAREFCLSMIAVGDDPRIIDQM